jgi:hypothetical protein
LCSSDAALVQVAEGRAGSLVVVWWVLARVRCVGIPIPLLLRVSVASLRVDVSGAYVVLLGVFRVAYIGFYLPGTVEWEVWFVGL